MFDAFKAEANALMTQFALANGHERDELEMTTDQKAQLYALATKHNVPLVIEEED